MARPPATVASGSTAATPSTASLLPPRWASAGTSSAPTASPAMVSPSRTPKIRPMSWGGTERCSSVRAATFSREWLAPATTSRATVPAVPGPNATTARAALKTRAAATIGRPSRRPTRTALAVAASTAPTPNPKSR